jgi:uncharacterized protein YjgD (DUF1641 family)
MSNNFSFDRRRNVIIRSQNHIVNNFQLLTQNENVNSQLRNNDRIIELFNNIDDNDNDKFINNRVFANA